MRCFLDFVHLQTYHIRQFFSSPSNGVASPTSETRDLSHSKHVSWVDLVQRGGLWQVPVWFHSAAYQPCPPRWSLPRGRDALVHHTSEVVSSLCFTWFLAPPHSAYRVMFTESMPMRSLCWKSTWPSRVVSLATRDLCLFLACQKIAHPLLRSTGPSARAIASRASCTSDDTST